jgi:hypothetical protein
MFDRMGRSPEAIVKSSPAGLAAWLGGVLMLGRGGCQQLNLPRGDLCLRSARSPTLEPREAGGQGGVFFGPGIGHFVMAITHEPKLATRETLMAACAKSWRRE